MPHKRRSTFNKILVGYDGSAQAKKALDVAFSLAHVMDSKILVFAVARPPEPATSVEVHAVLDDAREHFEEDFKRINQMAADSEISLETQLAVGHPAEQIIHRAEQEKIDLVVLGRRGTSLFEKWILGSVSERVLRYAHCPVMVVR
jgi:nucleotide-binding universal stress UspA family protein